jgi:hypothetical protein
MAGIIRHYDEATELYTASFFGKMTSEEYASERALMHQDLERYQPHRFLIDYTLGQVVLTLESLRRLAENKRLLELTTHTWVAVVAPTGHRQGTTTTFIHMIGAGPNFAVFTSMVDAKLWLNSQTPLRLQLAPPRPMLRIFGSVVLAVGLASLAPYLTLHSTKKPLNNAVAAMISKASRKS